MVRALEATELVVGDNWLVARYGQVHCTYFGPGVSARGFDAHLEQLAKDIDERDPSARIGVLYYVPESATMDSPRRRRLAKMLDARKDKLQQTTAAYALATGSPFVRGVLTTLFWLAPPGYPHKMVAEPRKGLVFIRQHLLGIDVDGIDASFASLLSDKRRRAV